MNRRFFLLAGAASLVGCATSTPASRALADAMLIIGAAAPPTGLAGAYAAVSALYVVPPATDKQIRDDLAAAQGLLVLLQTTKTPADVAAELAGVLSVSSQIINIVAPLVSAGVAADPRLAGALLALQAATVLLPIAQAVVAQLGAQPAGALAVSQRFRSGMTVERARAVLGG